MSEGEDVPELRLRSVGELVSAVRTASEDTSGWSPTWYRGQSQASWNLEPKVWRNARTLRKTDPSQYETNLMHRFRGRAGLYGPDLGFDDRAAWLQTVQHHGLPTRLLDWSRSPMVAAYFAIENALKDDQPASYPAAAIWALTAHGMNIASTNGHHSVTPAIESGICRALVEGAFWGDHYAEINALERNRLWNKKAQRQARNSGRQHDFVPEPFPTCLAVMANETDLRMLVQQGAFTVHSAQCGPINVEPKFRHCILKFTIPGECVWALAQEIRACGFDEASIYPDLDHLGNELERIGRHVGANTLDPSTSSTK